MTKQEYEMVWALASDRERYEMIDRSIKQGKWACVRYARQLRRKYV
ncbi:TPA: hypothetical protein ACJRVK_001633 [Streptococcus agalactiae]|nr:hypothetical protein [Streptococcus agalactiae]HEN0570696.1 hypothetical protein [Streptococcus agalactiae]HEN2237833.1 hypothetical protein [Streptococcus agalactiae]HEN6126936.1 hypothetical protein [Streptococcus agalactiae]HEN6755626.1 hypothetical protein [Streptococcus agalactiae]